MPSSVYLYDGVTHRWRKKGRPAISITPESVAYDWSNVNQPWTYTNTTDWSSRIPSGATIVNLQTGSSDFYTNLKNTCDAAAGRVIVQLGVGTYHFNQFRLIGSSGSPTYAFGFWHTKLQGLVGAGPDKTFIQMDANSMTQSQLDDLASMDSPSFAPNSMGFMRLDGTSSSSPVYLGGITFQAEDQQMLTSTATTASPAMVVPQPAPHNGVVLYNGTYATVSHCRFLAAGRASTSSPPFEHANIGTQRGTITFYNCEFDGRRASWIDPAQPRRCGVVMVNNETYSEFRDCWFHHSNVSRYAANDQNSNTQGQYVLVRCKAEQITNNQNRDPALNGGASLGGYTNATPFGWESCNGTITLTDCIISQDNNVSSGQVPMHLQLTSVGSRNPQGGRLYVNGGSFLNTGWSQLDGFVGFRIQKSTYWWIDGVNSTLFVYHPNGQRLTPYEITGAWPPSASTLSAAGITPETHYIIRAA